MTCSICLRERVVTIAIESVVWKKRHTWRECVDCYLRAEGKKA